SVNDYFLFDYVIIGLDLRNHPPPSIMKSGCKCLLRCTFRPCVERTTLWPAPLFASICTSFLCPTTTSMTRVRFLPVSMTLLVAWVCSSCATAPLTHAPAVSSLQPDTVQSAEVSDE